VSLHDPEVKAPSCLNLGTKCQLSDSRPGRFTSGETVPVPTEHGAGCVPEQVWAVPNRNFPRTV